MIIALAYEVDMAHIFVQLSGMQHAIQIKADKVERNVATGRLEVKDSQGRLLGEFDLVSVAGWWVSTG